MSKHTHEQIRHALAKLTEIADKFYEGKGTQRDLFQFGYNAGRLAELTESGRAVWDTLKHKVEKESWMDVILIVAEWLPEVEVGLVIKSPIRLKWDEYPRTNPAATR